MIVVLLAVGASAVVGVVLLALGAVAAYSSIRTVEEGELVALFLFGRMAGVLEPGLNVVPPFVSRTYPIDSQTMTIDRGGVRSEVPEEFQSAVREATDD